MQIIRPTMHRKDRSQWGAHASRPDMKSWQNNHSPRQTDQQAAEWWIEAHVY